MQARVERNDLIIWNGQSVTTQLVIYRADGGSGLTSNREARGKLWVHPNGMVLKQEVAVYNSRLQFVRLPKKQGRTLAAELGEDWAIDLPRSTEARLLAQLQRRAKSP
jgi:hypothetical protein